MKLTLVCLKRTSALLCRNYSVPLQFVQALVAAVAPLLSHRLHRSLACRSACWRTSWCSNRSAGPGAAAAALLACRRCSAPRMPSAGGRLRAAAVTLHNANAHAAVWFDNEHR